jgi:predicted unusual protein kinase regulating ubiquinone biosynthesis (AarF/ABC1/UbiB family)
MIKTRHIQRYKQIAQLLWKYGRSDLVKQMDVDDELEIDVVEQERPRADPNALADDLEAMGPTFVKLGQVLSSRPDLVPEPYLKALARLQDRVKPFPYAEVEEIVQSELGARISKAFSRFDPDPIAGASLGQVHMAALRDGSEVVVKVQRPGVAKQVIDDFEVLAEIAQFLDAHTEIGRKHRFAEMVEEIRSSIVHELNYEREAQNLTAISENLAEFDLIRIPQPINDYCTRRVLTMEYVRGAKITKLSPIVHLEIDGCDLAGQLFKAYLKQVLVDGVFHADPHPGNVFLTDEGQIALLDLGMVGHTTPAMQASLLKILIAVSESKAEVAADVVCRISETAQHFDRAQFEKRISQLVVERHGQALEQINVGKTLLAVTRIAADSGLYVPSDLTMLGKTLLQLDEVGRILDPDFDPDTAIRRDVSAIMTRHLGKDATKGSIFSTLLDLRDFLVGLPVRLNKIMDAVTDKDIEVKVRALDVDSFMEGLQKVANRITSGLILAALIVGASLLMRVDTDWRVFGYPGLAILCFLAAAAGGVFLLVNIFVQDRNNGRVAR